MEIKQDENIESVGKDIEKEMGKRVTTIQPGVTEGMELLMVMVKACIDKEDDVKIEIHQGEQTTVYQVTVDTSDLGKLIGKKGMTAASIRRILYGFSKKHGFRSIMEITE